MCSPAPWSTATAWATAGSSAPGEFQRMTAGTGIRHSEFNPSADEPVHLYQIWLLPERAGLTPSYEQKAVEPPAGDGSYGWSPRRRARAGRSRSIRTRGSTWGRSSEESP